MTDRVFVHALNTVKKVPKTGASRPPPSERLRLYGLYKQAMEGDVDGVMERPAPGPGTTDEDVQRERDKWDAWNSQKGLSRTESKRRYIEALIETMHRYANTPYGIPSIHLVAESLVANLTLSQRRERTCWGTGVCVESDQGQLTGLLVFLTQSKRRCSEAVPTTYERIRRTFANTESDERARRSGAAITTTIGAGRRGRRRLRGKEERPLAASSRKSHHKSLSRGCCSTGTNHHRAGVEV